MENKQLFFNLYAKLTNQYVLQRTYLKRHYYLFLNYIILTIISPIVIENALIKVIKSIKNRHVIAFNSPEFFELLAKNGQSLLKEVDYNADNMITVDKIFNIIIFEYLLVEGFFKGNKNLQMLPQICHIQLKNFYTLNPFLSKLELDTSYLKNLVSFSEKKMALKKLISYVTDISN